tara:strand:- start:905 stop:1267 length:363 start_codon:yes stop_codon:yes gene_type:complete
MAFGGLDFKSIKDGVLSSDGLDGMSQLDSINRAAKNALERTKLRSEYSRKIADQDADAALGLAKMQYGLTDGDIFNSQLEKGLGIVGSLDGLGLFDSFKNKEPVKSGLSGVLGNVLSGWG